MATIGPLTGRILMQIGDREPAEVATFEVPLAAVHDRGVVKIGPAGELREILAAGFEDMARQLRA